MSKHKLINPPLPVAKHPKIEEPESNSEKSSKGSPSSAKMQVQAAPQPAASQPAAQSTTRAGESFIRTPLDQFEPPYGTMGLPGLGKVATEKLAALGIRTPIQVLGQWMAFDGDDEVFLAYLEDECGVVFRGNNYASAEEIKKALCATLAAKWNLLRFY